MKRFWANTLPLIVSGMVLSGLGGGFSLIWLEIKFHVQVIERLSAIEKKIGIQQPSTVAKN
jgi:hypothetical protein